jgi:biotin carboxylase
MHIAFVSANPAALQALRSARQAGHQVTFLESAVPVYPLTAGNLALVSCADRVVKGVATTNADALTLALRECHAQWPLDVVSSQDEMTAEATAVAAQWLGLRSTGAAGVITARHKERCRQALGQAGLACARFALARSEAEVLAAAQDIGYPVVLKPPSGTDSLLAFVARDPEQARAACRAVLAGLDALPSGWQEQFSRGVLVEELLTGRLVSAEVGVRGPEFFPFCLSGRFRWAGHEVVEMGACMPAEVTEAERTACFGYAAAVCRAIGLDLGIFHLEIMLTPRGPVLVEANPRVMGGVMPSIYQRVTGLDIFAALAQILAGDPVVEQPTAFAGCGAGCKVMALDGGTIAPGASLRWLAALPGVVQVFGFEDHRTGPGKQVAPGQLMARFIVHEASYQEATALIQQALSQLAGELGLALRTEWV